MVGVVGVEADGFGDGGEGGLGFVEVAQDDGVDVVGEGPVGGEADGGGGGLEGVGSALEPDAAEGEQGVDLGAVGGFGEGGQELALGVGGTGLREEETGAGEAGAHFLSFR